MNLYIQIKDGKPFEHPIVESNFLEAFPHIDVNNLPPEFAKFVRLEPPKLGLYEMRDDPDVTYELVDGVYTDVFHIRQMTQEERTIVQNIEKDAWNILPNRSNFSAWIFNEDLCKYMPPIPYPNDGKNYFWQGTTTSWVEIPQKPDDGKVYKLDHASATWVEVPQV